ncbi:hypothetical protein LCGC14_1652060 [marine sediment metagenome]|uniref:Uncharacterized protein n=1 Tax=marine sediment metagenome TaxID=412755 RepID=A0A0F9IJ14_9ZZZZ
MAITLRFPLVVSLLVCCPFAAAETGKVVLSTETMWRTRLVFEPKEILLKDGTVDHVKLKLKENWRKVVTVREFEPVKLPFFRVPTETPADWMRPDFDDGDWARAVGPMLLDDEKRVEWKLLLLRATFEVADPTKAAGLELSVDYKGGIVVYLNGRELTRQHMPKGILGLYTCAEPEPKEAFLFPSGYLGMREGWRKPFPAWTNMVQARVRHLREVPIPLSMLRKGANVLAMAVRASDLHPVAGGYRAFRDPFSPPYYSVSWFHAQLLRLELRSAGGQVRSMRRRPAGGRRCLQ